MYLTVIDIPEVPEIISGLSEVCNATSNTYSIDEIPGATSYSWTLPNGWTGNSTTNSIDATAAINGGTITVTAGNDCGVSSERTFEVTVIDIPEVPEIISGLSEVCNATSNTYSIDDILGATSYSWILPNGWTGNSTTNSIDVISGVSAGTITVTANNTCGSSVGQAMHVAVIDIPEAPEIINGLSEVCNSTSNTYLIDEIPGATSYSWVLPNGWTGSSTTNSIDVTTAVNGGTITVTTNNICGSSVEQAMPVAVIDIPEAPEIMNGLSEVCNSTANTYSIDEIPGATSYSWTLPNGWTGSSTTNSIDATAAVNGGTITVTANNTCGSSIEKTLGVMVIDIPSTPETISGLAEPCKGSSTTYSIEEVLGATSYTWSLPDGWTGTSTIHNIDVTAGESGGIISVTANNTCGSSIEQALNVAVNNIPLTPEPINGLAEICKGASSTYSIEEVLGATSYTWSLPDGWTGTSTVHSIDITAGESGGIISVTANSTCGSSIERALEVIIPIIDNSIIVSGNKLTSNQTGSAYQWIDCDNGSVPIVGETSQSITVSSSGNYGVIVTDGSCSVTSDCEQIVISGFSALSDNDLSFYPNPFENEFSIEMGESNVPLFFEILNAAGHVVFKESIKGKTSIKMNQLPSGLYIVKIERGKELEFRKIIKR